jgi:hypothetical protein
VLAAAALLIAASASYGLAATDARAGTPAWDMVQADSLVAGVPEVVQPESGAQQAATTEQAAGAAASATQQQPTNVVVTVRINSPGDDGPISQTNVVVAGSNSSNAASTTQGDVPSAGAAPAQNAATGQEAGATATATQDAAGNLVVVVRINSPGDNGPISQTNAAVAGANAANTSTTNQGQPAAGAEPAAPASGGAAAPRRPARRPAQERPRKQPAATSPAAGPSAAPAAPVVRHESPTAAAADRAHASHPAVARPHKKAKRAGASSFDRGRATTPLHRVAAGAADVFNAVAPRTPVAKAESADVSRSVVYSLLVVLALVATFLFWPQRPEWLRRVEPRIRLRG